MSSLNGIIVSYLKHEKEEYEIVLEVLSKPQPKLNTTYILHFSSHQPTHPEKVVLSFYQTLTCNQD